VSPVKNKLGFYIPEDGILHSHRHEHIISHAALPCCLSGGHSGTVVKALRYKPEGCGFKSRCE
jgi:hypothetical protein